jgi:hypothetical protein
VERDVMGTTVCQDKRFPDFRAAAGRSQERLVNHLAKGLLEEGGMRGNSNTPPTSQTISRVGPKHSMHLTRTGDATRKAWAVNLMAARFAKSLIFPDGGGGFVPRRV